MSVLLLSFVLAGALWGVMFGLQWGNFWVNMTLSASLLAAIALWQQRSRVRTLFAYRENTLSVGINSALALYLAFFLGDRIGTRLFSFAPEQVMSIYAMKAQMSPALIAVLLVGIIAPAEEIFWRGFLQERLCDRYGRYTGWLIAAGMYAGVHLWAWNFMLFMAALLCGLFWGVMYLRWRSLAAVIISHAVWDVLIFVILPVR